MQEIQEQAEAARAAARADTTWNPLDNVLAGVRQAAATVSATAASGGGGYKFDRETIEAKIREFEDLRDEMTKAGAGLNRIAMDIRPPSDDPPAVAQVQATARSLSAAWEHNRQMATFAQEYINGLNQAIGNYSAQEEDSSGVFSDGAGDGGALGTGVLFQ